jgi:hypothetical protein
MLGFVLGALVVLAIPRSAPAPVPAPPPEKPPAAQPPAPRLTTIEAVFAEWGKYAVWDQDVTEVALWNSGTGDYSDAYEVLRAGDALFFRSIPRLTRPILTHGLPDDENRPIEFTETEAQRAQWMKENGDASWNAMRQVLRGPEAPATKPATP